VTLGRGVLLADLTARRWRKPSTGKG